jgi:uncharacterized protein
MTTSGTFHQMRVDKNEAIATRDGHVLRANVFRPDTMGRFPVIMSLGIYGKDVHFAEAYKPQWEALKKLYPDIDANGSSGRYLRWELPDPERWVPDGYVMIAVDSRGSGQSPGYLDPFSPVEMRDYYDAIEWAAAQPWSNGKVGLLGISYLAITQWQVAGLRPPHLAAICPWEGGSDLYRDWSHHGGIFSDLFPTAWMPRQVLPNQHGNAKTHHRDRETGERTTGAADFVDDVLRGNRANHPADLLAHPLDDEWYKQRSPRFDRIEVPVLSAGNWGGPALHLRGNIEGYLRSASREKWLFMHIGTHFESFYLPDYIKVQKRFFDHYLKGEANGWAEESPVQLEIRQIEGATTRAETEWPLARTQWTRYALDAQALTLATAPPSDETKAEYHSLGDGLTFTTAPFTRQTEFTGPVAARLFVASSTVDMDIFATLRLFAGDGKEVRFVGASEPVPLTRGWLRASHRKLDPALSTPHRPYHAHDERQLLEPGEIYAVDLEIWPTSIVVPASYRVALTLQGKDFEFPDLPGRMLHHSEDDRPQDVFDTTCSVVSGPERTSYLTLPLIPGDGAE